MWNYEDHTELRVSAARPTNGAASKVPGQPGELEALREEIDAANSENETLRGLIREAREELESHRDELTRSVSEFANYRKRIAREKESAHDDSVRKVLTSLLPVLDDLSAAREHGDLEDGPFAAITRKLDGILASHGLLVVNETGVEFNPEIHEAVIAQSVEGFKEDTVVRVFRVGYTTESAGLIRAAQVMVAK